MLFLLLPVLLFVLGLALVACAAPWRARLAEDLPRLGHRNWIVVADGAYPWQARAGIETVATGADHLEVLRALLAALEQSPHVRPEVHLDAELAHVGAPDAPGIEAFRGELARVLGQRSVVHLPHASLIARLDADASLYRVLVLKSDLALPYTSVFVRLECGYWSPEAEARLRASRSGR